MDADELERLIDQRARAIVNESRAAEARSYSLEQLSKAVERTKAARDSNLREPTTYLGQAVRCVLYTGLLAFAAFVILGSAITVLPIQPAELACPILCEGCSLPARSFTWSYTGPRQSKKGRMGSAFICTNREVPIDTLKWFDVVDESMSTRLQPYIVSVPMQYALNLAIGPPLFALLLGPLWALRRRRRVMARRPVLEAAYLRAQAELDGFDARGASETPYR